ncbi:hypothetical protein DXG03_002893 [Asterophora parasitica]|uniref:BTB domain-containing protein n=1 Tax=Asterophora parasitica TaxID=117018 RepID=A0A9P7KEM9_9AGAR|nr:hypothetical protein DXG03_002893 [Asterophora parasitica]
MDNAACHSDWDNVFQYVADPIDLDALPDKHAASRSEFANFSGMPTPPLSHDGSPIHDDPPETSNLVSVSTTFYPGSLHQSLMPDAILLSEDSVFFYIHSHILLAASDNGFHSLLSPPPPPSKDQDRIINVPETSAVINIILHTIYDMSCSHYSPSFSQLSTAVKRLPFYGIQPQSYIMTSTPLFTLLHSHAPLCPLELYTLAASFDLYELAVSTSSHLLSFPLSSMSDEMSDAIGPVYLKRLFFLHFGRADALKRVLLPPPHPHPPTEECDFSDQKKLTRAWALASAYLAWDARPDLSTSAMESALRPLEEHLVCNECKQTLRERIKDLVVQWSLVKRTI